METWMTSWNRSCVNQVKSGAGMLRKLYHIVFNRENWLALVLALILVALVIFTADTSPTWIYQGF